MTDAIFNAFEKWIGQRSRLEFANYGDIKAFSQESRSISKHRKRAKNALNQARQYPFNAEAMTESLRRAYSGRLSWVDDHFEYCTGQYFPTEFAQAAAAVLESYIDAVRPKHTPAPEQTFSTISDLKAASYAAGSHWFDRSSMKFFRTRIERTVYSGLGGIYFVTSEDSGYGSGRRFSIRKFDPATADVDTFGPFNELSKERAQRIARIAAHDPAASDRGQPQMGNRRGKGTAPLA